MTTYPLPTLIWGQPKLKLSFAKRALEGNSDFDVLLCEIINPEVTSKLLRIALVSRQVAEDVVACFTIKDSNDNNIVFEATPQISDFLDTPTSLASRRVRIPPTSEPFTFRIVTVDKNTGEVFAISNDAGREAKVPLQVGLFYVAVKINLVGRCHCSTSQKLVVINRKPFAYWEV